ncbi:thioredoxin domain-containing protein [Lysinibacillus telephonicus]|uniref:Thioredoxin domain-containing protein n=1 Tax=Lysinibacillus telephonicus TaxID=1714840 RepID=A0A431UCX2_9BACI|nr:thioredoxin domain-containing protein [Lysinibacillus telephonicus]RTQ86977.1 thioredoxin domain-containing protein [Lysinibacillus telephonicus]
MTTNKKSNRLIAEKSPYLLQHAYNPVDWHPWGEEAFEKAKKEGKPVFVSIGYSTCHWCHVMEKESFEDEEVAKLLNERFISVKVDREERPDIDSIYMTVCQLMNGHGGWPLNVFLTEDKVPFYVGTYFPKESRPQIPGIKEVIIQLYNLYKNDAKQIEDVTKQVYGALQSTMQAKEEDILSETSVHNGFRSFLSMFDESYGGFGSAPKFPTPHHYMFLLRYYHYTNDERALNMAVKTLDALEKGGIYDHIGFGFARYSTDDEYLVPHFEKMLYDNALLTIAYTECFQVTNSEDNKKIVEGIITYVLRKLASPDGGFYSAEDADSEGEEGKFYLWTFDEVISVLGDDLGMLYNTAYGITEDGNFDGKNIPNLIDSSFPQLAEQNGLTINELLERLESARKQLFEYRELRVHPHKDDKILTAWNALMIAALAKASKVFNNNSYLEAALKATQFIETTLTVNDRLMVRFRDGEVKQEGFIDDYAYMLWGYIELYEATHNISFLKKAKNLTKQMFELFWDKTDGGFYFYSSHSEQLLIRQKETYDSAMPSGNSVAALQLLRLARLTGDSELEESVYKIFEAFAFQINDYPMGHSYMLMAYLTTLMKMKEVVVVGEITNKQQPFLTELHHGFHPEIMYLVCKDPQELKDVAPFTMNYKKLKGSAAFYICENFMCHQPITEVNEAIELVNKNN